MSSLAVDNRCIKCAPVLRNRHPKYVKPASEKKTTAMNLWIILNNVAVYNVLAEVILHNDMYHIKR
jgi:hypothetical protein